MSENRISCKRVVSLQGITAADAGWLGRMMALVPQPASENGRRSGPEGGLRLIVDSGKDGGQEVAHLHFHILGDQRPWQARMAPAA